MNKDKRKESENWAKSYADKYAKTESELTFVEWCYQQGRADQKKEELAEKIQIVEDNLKEYGVCDITIEEFNYLKDELYSSGCLAGMEVGRADERERIVSEIKKWYWDSDKQRLADDPCVVDAMIDLFIRTVRGGENE